MAHLAGRAVSGFEVNYRGRGGGTGGPLKHGWALDPFTALDFHLARHSFGEGAFAVRDVRGGADDVHAALGEAAAASREGETGDCLGAKRNPRVPLAKADGVDGPGLRGLSRLGWQAERALPNDVFCKQRPAAGKADGRRPACHDARVHGGVPGR